MNILLLYPNLWGRAFTPIGLAMMSSVLKQRGHAVKLFDTTFYSCGGINEQSEGERYLSYKATDLSKYGVEFEKRDAVEELQGLLGEYKPGLIVFSIFSSHLHSEGEYNMYYHGKNLLDKTGVKDIPVVVGGIVPTVMPEKVLNDGIVSMVCLGECEDAIGELADKLDRKEDITNIKNIWVKDGSKIYKNEARPLLQNLDDFPFMDLSIFNDKNFYRPYKGNVYRMIDAELSRGCIYRCDYCVETIMQNLYGFGKAGATNVLTKEYHREKSVDRILEEFSFLKEKFNLQFIRFQDSNFLSMREHKLSELSERFPVDVGLPFYIETRPEGLTEKRVSLLKKMGCVGVGMGLEIGSQLHRKEVLNRNCKDDTIIQACDNLRKNGMRATTYNIIGFPDETREDIMKTVELNRRARPEAMTVAFYSPYLGTPMCNANIDRNIMSNDIITLDQKLYTKVSHGSMSNEELVSLRNTFIMYVLAPKIFWSLIFLAEKDNFLGNLLYKFFRYLYKP
ncbi:MAG: B12-binding domain-containing radical SAM protein [Candidatus Scalindua sp.]|jgi:anaerobic magnesium-protoporphyrin IX monomethyl ester cyclase|nr:B12-binding domain-containing radical SAM protein [Candidatus Scalindua sp.]